PEPRTKLECVRPRSPAKHADNHEQKHKTINFRLVHASRSSFAANRTFSVQTARAIHTSLQRGVKTTRRPITWSPPAIVGWALKGFKRQRMEYNRACSKKSR